MKVQMGPRQALELIAIGIRNGNTHATLALIEDLLAQLPDDTVFTSDNPPRSDATPPATPAEEEP